MHYYSEEANEFYKGERYSSFGCTNPCKHMKVLTEFKHKTKIVDKKTETEDPVVKILFPRSIEVTKEVWRKTFLSFGKFNLNKSFYNLTYVAEQKSSKGGHLFENIKLTN